MDVVAVDVITPIFSPNLMTVGVMSLVSMGLGALWYSKKVFGKSMGDACKMKDKEKEKECTCSAKTLVGEFVITFILAYVLALFVGMSQVFTAVDGMKIGLLTWLGFVATTQFCGVLWCKMPLKAFFITSGFKLIMMAIMGAVFAIYQ
ncbi:MAG: hypothetical protein JWO53_1022 [Chlamydiia bacterium]|nr:hypothetical protein [Chlamydiia bacterium]